MRNMIKNVVKAVVAIGALGVVAAVVRKTADKKNAYSDFYEDDDDEFDTCWEDPESGATVTCEGDCEHSCECECGCGCGCNSEEADCTKAVE